MAKKVKSSSVVWGVSLLFVAAFLVAGQFSDFANVGVGSVIAAGLATAYIVQCFIRRYFAWLPVPLAVLYVVFRAPLGLPDVQTWALILAAVLASIGLEMLLPRRHRRVHFEFRRGDDAEGGDGQVF